MWEEAFLARLARKRELADQGHVELEDQLGPERDLGPAVRTGLLKPAPPCCPLQRYHGLVPTRKGARYLDYCGEHHLITVRAGQVSAFEAALFDLGGLWVGGRVEAAGHGPFWQTLAILACVGLGWSPWLLQIARSAIRGPSSNA